MTHLHDGSGPARDACACAVEHTPATPKRPWRARGSRYNSGGFPVAVLAPMTSERLPASPVKIRRALLSVSDKTGLIELARALAAAGVELLSTGGTAKAIRDAGLAVKDVSDVTGFPEMMDGRVKTLHPLVHGGLLGRAGIDDAVMAQHGIAPIDLLVLNLYPFEKVSADPDSSMEDIVENIDIGGPAMLRSAAKNFARVAVATDPAQYAGIVEELQCERRRALGEDALRALGRRLQPRRPVRRLHQRLPVGDRRRRRARAVPGAAEQQLRQGDGPALRREPAPARRVLPRPVAGAGHAGHLHPAAGQGTDLTTTSPTPTRRGNACASSSSPACVIVKHANPCGVAEGVACGDAYELAYATDPTSAFGGIIAFNTTLDAATAKAILDRQFVEVLIAPDYEDGALDYAKKKANVRVLRIPHGEGRNNMDVKRVGSGLLMQTSDIREVTPRRAQGGDQARADRGADGRPAVRLARGQVRQVQRHRLREGPPHRRRRRRADEPRGLGEDRRASRPRKPAWSCPGSVMASDAFFPFRDGIDAAAAAGIKAVIQPGGSMRDNEVIAAADEHGIAMVFTGVRHFRH